mmetsp:Transcript_9769/g.28132  ORF Transcript_9769/g.28132 Transcript_9769/m.28132 type:complete len:213 (+) Transcript_9769:288-926(+)
MCIDLRGFSHSLMRVKPCSQVSESDYKSDGQAVVSRPSTHPRHMCTQWWKCPMSKYNHFPSTTARRHTQHIKRTTSTLCSVPSPHHPPPVDDVALQLESPQHTTPQGLRSGEAVGERCRWNSSWCLGRPQVDVTVLHRDIGNDTLVGSEAADNHMVTVFRIRSIPIAPVEAEVDSDPLILCDGVGPQQTAIPPVVTADICCEHPPVTHSLFM